MYATPDRHERHPTAFEYAHTCHKLFLRFFEPSQAVLVIVTFTRPRRVRVAVQATMRSEHGKRSTIPRTAARIPRTGENWPALLRVATLIDIRRSDARMCRTGDNVAPRCGFGRHGALKEHADWSVTGLYKQLAAEEKVGRSDGKWQWWEPRVHTPDANDRCEDVDWYAASISLLHAVLRCTISKTDRELVIF